MTSLVTETFLDYLARLEAVPEYREEVEYVRNLLEKGTEGLTADQFFRQYVYVVLCSYWKEQYARKEWDCYFRTGNPECISNRIKRAAVANALNHAEEWHKELMQRQKDENKLIYLRTLPFMGGEALGYHLARNIGIDAVKPDRHLKRFAEQFGFKTPLEMCEHVRAEIGGAEKVGVIDVVFWRAANLGWR